MASKTSLDNSVEKRATMLPAATDSTDEGAVLAYNEIDKEMERRVIRKTDMVVLPLVRDRFYLFHLSTMETIANSGNSIDVSCILFPIPRQAKSQLCCRLRLADGPQTERQPVLMDLVDVLRRTTCVRVSFHLPHESIATCQICWSYNVGCKASRRCLEAVTD